MTTVRDALAELLPCPFCGGDSHPSTVRYSSVTIKEQNWGQDTFHHVTCAHCGSSNRGLVGYRTPELAAEHWNRRARPPLAAPPAAPADKPAAWMLPGSDSIITHGRKLHVGKHAERWTVPLYSSDTIARLRAELAAARADADHWRFDTQGGYANVTAAIDAARGQK